MNKFIALTLIFYSVLSLSEDKYPGGYYFLRYKVIEDGKEISVINPVFRSYKDCIEDGRILVERQGKVRNILPSFSCERVAEKIK